MHNGEIVELVIRRDSLSISELSRRLKVSRRSIYNWFTQEKLSADIICRIGEVLNHDFSVEFPDLLKKVEQQTAPYHFRDGMFDEENLLNSAQYWRDKYINLLERHNDFLSRNSRVSAAFH